MHASAAGALAAVYQPLDCFFCLRMVSCRAVTDCARQVPGQAHRLQAASHSGFPVSLQQLLRYGLLQQQQQTQFQGLNADVLALFMREGSLQCIAGCADAQRSTAPVRKQTGKHSTTGLHTLALNQVGLEPVPTIHYNTHTRSL
jgi:hypothetical protein